MTTALQNTLSKGDLVQLMSLSYRSLTCQCHDDLTRLVSGLNDVFDFFSTLYASVDLTNAVNDNINRLPVKIYNISYPLEFIQSYITSKKYLTDTRMCELINRLVPAGVFSSVDRCSKEYISYFQNDRLASVTTWLHGTLNPNTRQYVGFFFVGPKEEHRKRVLSILEYIVPFYSQAFSRIRGGEKETLGNLTPKEIEILQWLKEGKSSWDISVMLHCSKRTIDFHVENAKTKLNAVNRTQAVATALHQGVITY